MLGLNALNYLGAKRIDVFRDSELVINQVNDSYQSKHSRMRAYRNEVWDMLSNFFTEYKVRVVLVLENQVADSLATTTGNFKVPIYSKMKYKILVVHRPSIHDNYKYWNAFEDDLQIKIFHKMTHEFVNTQIDTKNQNIEDFQENVQFDEKYVEQEK